MGPIKPAILARSDSACQIPLWKRDLAAAITRPEPLLDMLGLPRRLLPAAREASQSFRLLVPRGFAALMEHGNPDDPLLRQVLPLGHELQAQPGFQRDPVGDAAALSGPGLLQKYRGRALLIATGACAVHCRYCFRRHYPYAEHGGLHDRTTGAIAQLAASPDIEEVILSGGDPLMLDDHLLADLIAKLDAVPHLKRLRVHTRLPIVLPSRVTPELCGALAASRLGSVVVVHANHPRELSTEVGAALDRLRQSGVVLLNQSVLLSGVNDRVAVLAALSEGLFDAGVLPYYLHMLDRVAGAAHFSVPTAVAVELISQLRRRLPGYLVPRLVREEAGRPHKTPVI